MPKTKQNSRPTTKTKSAEAPEAMAHALEEISPTNVLEILHEDHLIVQDLFFQYTQIDDPKEKKELVDQILKELYLHASVEEEIVYPQARENAEGEEVETMMDEADTEHHVAKVLMAELASTKPSDDHFDAKVTVLCEVIKHHVGEEEKEMFKKIRDSDVDLEALGEEVLELKETLKEKYAAKDLMKIWTELKEYKL